jgi:hypothetical protein
MTAEHNLNLMIEYVDKCVQESNLYKDEGNFVEDSKVTQKVVLCIELLIRAMRFNFMDPLKGKRGSYRAVPKRIRRKRCHACGAGF